jgi:uncharacterized membrane protein
MNKRIIFFWGIIFGIVISIPSRGADTTFTKDVRPIIERRCTLCHAQRWSHYAEAYKYREEIYKRVVLEKSMPQDNITGMSYSERRVFRDWHYDGSKQ